MASGGLAPLWAIVCFLMAALALVRGWRAARWLVAAGIFLLAGALTARGAQLGYWPLTSGYEFALAFAMSSALFALILPGRNRDPGADAGDRVIETLTIVMAAGLVAYARLGMPPFKREIQPVPPALHSIWLPLHVGSAALSYGALALAGVAGLVWLLRRPGRTRATWVQDRAIAGGYPLLTLSLIFGMIWAQVAWGRYWGWDLKETWTLITWLVYTFYWHVRRRPRWRGSRSAWLAVTGFLAVLFTFLGIGWLARIVHLSSLHLF